MTKAQRITRRKALTAIAVAPATVALSAVPAQSALGGELAYLIRLYFEQVAAFNRIAGKDGRTDQDNDALAEATYEATLERMVGVPARTRDDALAAIDWLVKEGADLESEYDNEPWGETIGDHAVVVTSIVDTVRGYIEERSA